MVIKNPLLARQFIDQDYVHIPGFIAPTWIEAAVEAWLEFSKLPQDVKDTYSFNYDEDGSPDWGYARKDQADGAKDNKEFYHFSCGLPALIARPLPVVLRLHAYAQVIHYKCMELMEYLIQQLDIIEPGMYRKLWVGSLTHSGPVVRFLKYYSSPDHIIAKPHPDKSVATLQIYESQEGLYGARVGDYKHLPTNEAKCRYILSRFKEIKKRHAHEVVLFAGQQAKYFLPEVQCLWHQVIDSMITIEGYERISLVFFYHALQKMLTQLDRIERNLFQ